MSASRRRSSRGRARQSWRAVAPLLLVAALLAAEIARLTTAAATVESRPRLAEALAPRHPSVLYSTAMAEVGDAAARGQLPPPTAEAMLRDLSRSAPANAQPLLVEAAIALKAGDSSRAEKLLLAARALDPRATAGRYLLADLWLREGRVVDGLGELAVLARLVRGTAVPLVPALSEFARTPGAAGRLKLVLESNPELKQPLLNTLASDASNAALVVQLDAVGPPSGGAPEWQKTLLRSLVAEKRYDRARQMWRRFSGIRAGESALLFNGEFRPLPALPPFNWAFASGSGGFAEPGPGSMRVLHYGRDNVSLASQLLLLPPGRYRFSVAVSGQPAPGALEWTITCLGSRAPLMRMPLARPGGLTASFAVPAGCEAQLLDLSGSALEMPRESDLRIGPAKLEGTGG